MWYVNINTIEFYYSKFLIWCYVTQYCTEHSTGNVEHRSAFEHRKIHSHNWLYIIYIHIYIYEDFVARSRYQAGISNYILQFTVGCNNLSLPEIPASGFFKSPFIIYIGELWVSVVSTSKKIQCVTRNKHQNYEVLSKIGVLWDVLGSCPLFSY